MGLKKKDKERFPYLLRIAIRPTVCSLLGEVPKTVEENVHSACLDEIVCKGSSWSMVLFNLDTYVEWPI